MTTVDGTASAPAASIDGTSVASHLNNAATVRIFNDLRIAGAQVRKVLLANAAEKLNLKVEDLRTEPGVVVAPNGQRLTYGEIATFGKVPSPLPSARFLLPTRKPSPITTLARPRC